MEIIEPRLIRLYQYWEAKRAGRLMPSRADVDPLDLGFVLGHLILLDVLHEPLRFRIRVHGTELAHRAGYDLTGKMLDELPIAEFRELAQQSFTQTVETQRPFHSMRDRFIDGKRHQYETLMLPLSEDGNRVNMLLIGLVYRDTPPSR
jgi:hypothetical protein